jgi:hypothetical protein
MNTTALADAPIEINHDDLNAAYMHSKLRYENVSLVKALETPSIYIALRNTAFALKKKRLAENSPAADLCIHAYSTLTPDSVEEAFANIYLMLSRMNQEKGSLSNPVFIIATNLAFLRGYLGDTK